MLVDNRLDGWIASVREIREQVVFYLVVEAPRQLGDEGIPPAERVGGEVSAVHHLQSAPLSLADVLVVSESSQVSPVVHSEEQGVAITEQGHVQEP